VGIALGAEETPVIPLFNGFFALTSCNLAFAVTSLRFYQWAPGGTEDVCLI